MQITPTNVGDIICRDQDAVYLRIEAVTDEFVHYRQETGDTFATFEHDIQGRLVQDRSRIQEFIRNATLGSALLSAELGAIRHLLDGASTHEQRMDANLVLESVKGMKQRLSDRISQHEFGAHGKQSGHRSLDAIISQASADAQSQQSPVPGITLGYDR